MVDSHEQYLETSLRIAKTKTAVRTRMPPSRTVELADIIQQHTRKVDEYLTSHDLPAPSFDISQPPRLPLPPEIQASQAAILEASDELTALTLGPVGTLIGRNPVTISSFLNDYAE